MKKIISYLLVLVMMLSLVPTFAYAAEDVKEEKALLETEAGKYIYPQIIEVEIFKKYSHEDIDADFFSGYVPKGMKLEHVELWNEDDQYNDDFNAIIRVEVPESTVANAINLATALHKHPKVKSINFMYSDKPVNYGDEAKKPFNRINDKDICPDVVTIWLFKCFSSESFDINSFKDYIPSDIEVEIRDTDLTVHNEMRITFKLKKEYQTNENAIKLAESLLKHPKVKISELNGFLYPIDPEVTETEGVTESESVSDTVETVIGDITDNESTKTTEAAQTVSEETVEAETEAVASVGNNNNKQTGDSLFIYVTLALLVSSVASTVVILKKGKKKED